MELGQMNQNSFRKEKFRIKNESVSELFQNETLPGFLLKWIFRNLNVFLLFVIAENDLKFQNRNRNLEFSKITNTNFFQKLRWMTFPKIKIKTKL